MKDKKKEYWNKRVNRIFEDNIKEKEIAQLYRKEYNAIEAKIIELYDKTVNDGITTRTDLYSFRRFQNVLKQLDEQNISIKSTLTASMQGTLEKVYEAAYSDVVKVIDNGENWNAYSGKMVESALKTKWEGGNFSSRIWDNTDALSRRIKADVVTAIVEGETRDTMVKSLKDDFNVGFSQADRLVRTEVMHCINQAQKQSYKDAGVGEVEWYAAEDERMCEVCGEMHGKRFKVDKAPDILHPNCRCTTLPVIPDEWFDLSEVPDEWLDEDELKEKYAGEKNVDNLEKSDIIDTETRVSGARITNLYSDEADDFAQSYYEEIRHFTTDVKHISENIGVSYDKINRIKSYLFIDKSKYNEDTGDWERFDPDCAVAHSWQRLMLGKDIKEHDKTLIKHELYEMQVKSENKGISHWDAHEIATKKYNYHKEAEEYYAGLEKHIEK